MFALDIFDLDITVNLHYLSLQKVRFVTLTEQALTVLNILYDKRLGFLIFIIRGNRFYSDVFINRI